MRLQRLLTLFFLRLTTVVLWAYWHFIAPRAAGRKLGPAPPYPLFDRCGKIMATTTDAVLPGHLPQTTAGHGPGGATFLIITDYTSFVGIYPKMTCFKHR